MAEQTTALTAPLIEEAKKGDDYLAIAPSAPPMQEEEKQDIKDDDYLISSDNVEVTCGIGWDFFDKAIDLDVTVIALDVYSLEMDAAYYNQTNILNDSIIHSGDNKDGVGDGDDEKIKINLKSIPSHCYSLWFLVNAYSGGTFQDVETAKFRFYNSSKKKLHSYSITMGYKNTAMLLGVLYRDLNEQDWHYKQIEKTGSGKNFVESKSILENELHLIYSQDIINDRPADRNKIYELKKSDQYVIHPSIDKVTIGLGWDASSGSSNIDVDASVIVFDEIPNTTGTKQLELEGIVSYSNLSYHDSIKHHGDNLTGAGDGDDEQIDMFLNKMGSDKIDILCVIINIYGGATSFRSIKNCFARLVDDKNHELCRFRLSGNYNTRAMIMCTINKKKNGCWALNAIGAGCKGKRARDSAVEAKKVCLGQELTKQDESSCCIIL